MNMQVDTPSRLLVPPYAVSLNTVFNEMLLIYTAKGGFGAITAGNLVGTQEVGAQEVGAQEVGAQEVGTQNQCP